jgi:hypothetical protein
MAGASNARPMVRDYSGVSLFNTRSGALSLTAKMAVLDFGKQCGE